LQQRRTTLKSQRRPLSPRFDTLMKRSRRDGDASRVAVSILRAHSRVAQTVERALAEADMTLPQFNILMELAASSDESLPLYAINARLISTPPNTSWLCSRMESKGLVRRRRDRDDARVVVVELTEKGWTAVAKSAPLVFAAEKELLKSYSRTELRSLGSLLARLLEPS
jgi:DNA-binding MarR family transcriptional regulator